MAAAYRSLALAGLASLALAACDRAGMPGFLSRGAAEGEAPVQGGATAASTVETDVEAPDVFAATEAGLWDGRPSLGGVWVAHPDATDPERVLIRNTASGQFVTGALFRRERETPGPRLQVSSDAAEELGLLAGQPTEIAVVALRRETVAGVAPPDGAAEPEPAPEPAPAATGAIETAALATPPSPAAAPGATRPGPRAALSGAEIAAATAATADTSAPAPAPATPAALAADPLAEPWIQVGIYSVESNAADTARRLRDAGVTPTVRAQSTRGKKFWRVIVGPAASAGERRAVLGKVRDLGFADAYYVTN